MTKSQTIETILNVELLDQVLGGAEAPTPPACKYATDNQQWMRGPYPQRLANLLDLCQKQLAAQGNQSQAQVEQK